jgi:hypothetical protein
VFASRRNSFTQSFIGLDDFTQPDLCVGKLSDKLHPYKDVICRTESAPAICRIYQMDVACKCTEMAFDVQRSPTSLTVDGDTETCDITGQIFERATVSYFTKQQLRSEAFRIC